MTGRIGGSAGLKLISIQKRTIIEVFFFFFYHQCKTIVRLLDS